LEKLMAASDVEDLVVGEAEGGLLSYKGYEV
jgi:hypothetical protein